jgi:alpha-beta hydrolase superfamily lysophospholipase
MFILWLLIPVLILLGLGLGLSFTLTRRAYLKEVNSPAEYGLAFEKISFQTADGLTLRGWLAPGSDPQRVVVILHGHGGSIDYDLQYVPYLHAAGYSVLQFDFRAHGRSQGSATTFGYLERRDVQGAVKFLRERGLTRIALHGFSLGGMVAMTSAPICPEVSVVVDDGGPARMRTALRGWCLERGIPAWLAPPLVWLALAATSLRFGTNLYRYEPVRWVGKIAPRPLMLIHGERDQYVTDFDDLLRAAKPGEVWRLPEEGHVTVSLNQRDEYWKRVIAFLNQNL